MDRIRKQHVPHSVGFEMAEERDWVSMETPCKASQVPSTEGRQPQGRHHNLTASFLEAGKGTRSILSSCGEGCDVVSNKTLQRICLLSHCKVLMVTIVWQSQW